MDYEKYFIENKIDSNYVSTELNEIYSAGSL